MVRCRWRMTVLDQLVRAFVLVSSESSAHMVYSAGHAEHASV